MIPHGGNLYRLRQRYPDAPEPLIDLSTGVNPYSYPLPAIPETAYTRLPEEAQIRQLREAAAEAYGVRDPDLIAVAAGTQLLISSLPRILPAAEAAILAPTYGEHAAVWSAAGADIREGVDPAVLERGDLAILCNPNNPDGRTLEPRMIADLQRRRARNGGLLIVDEAFAEFGEAHVSVVPAVPLPGLIVLRSFGKAYGLAGVRLGFLIAERRIVERVERAFGPWPVSGIAIHLACAALADTAWRKATIERLVQAGDRLASLLAAYGLDAVGSTSLFRLVRHENASAVAETLGRAGILVRDFPDRPDWLRFGLPPDEDAWIRLDGALAAGLERSP